MMGLSMPRKGFVLHRTIGRPFRTRAQPATANAQMARPEMAGGDPEKGVAVAAIGAIETERARTVNASRPTTRWNPGPMLGHR